MRNFKIIIPILSILLLSLFSCNKKEIEPPEIFEDSLSIQGEILDSNLEYIGLPAQAILIDSFLIIKDNANASKREFSIHIINVKQNKYITSTCRKGRGPKEIVNALSLSRSISNKRSFTVYSRFKYSFFDFNIDSILKNNNYLPKRTMTFKEPYLIPVHLPNHQYMAIGPFEQGRYRVSDSLGENHRYRFDYPQDPDHKNVPNKFKSKAYQGNFCLQLNGNYFAFGALNSGILEFFQATQDKILKIKDWHFYYPEYRIKPDPNRISAPVSPDNKFAFTAMSGTENYLYILYSGRTFREYQSRIIYSRDLLVFTWSGKPVLRYSLDREIWAFSVDEKDQTLYGITNLPEPALIKFKLSHK